MEDRLEEIKNAYAVEAAEYSDVFKYSHLGWLISEVERLRHERADVIEELARRYRGMFANPRSEPATTAVFREAQQLADRRMRRACNDV
jgi:hypothetical protein